MNALRSERGSIVLGGLTKMVLLFAVLGLIVYDGVAIGYTHFSTADHGSLAADKAGDVWRETNDITKAYQAAQASLRASGERIDPKTFSIEPETDTVRFRLTGHAPTLVAQRIPWTRPMTVVEVQVVTASAAPS
jgi:hypothetical protein